MLALTPLLTMLFATVLARLPFGYVSEESLDWVSLAGAVLVVTGSATCALAGRRAAVIVCGGNLPMTILRRLLASR